MNIYSISSLFTLFSGETDVKLYMPIISSAIIEVKSKLKPDTDLSDERLSYLCAAIANMRYTQILAARDRVRYPVAKTSSDSSQLDFANSLVREYWASINDLVADADFSFYAI